jgi:hypothetical protein
MSRVDVLLPFQIEAANVASGQVSGLCRYEQSPPKGDGQRVASLRVRGPQTRPPRLTLVDRQSLPPRFHRAVNPIERDLDDNEQAQRRA